MACVGGCIGGAGCLTHGEKDKTEVDKYGQEALEKSISDSIGVYFASKDAKARTPRRRVITAAKGKVRRMPILGLAPRAGDGLDAFSD